jgi:hypothetical protein
MSEHMTSPPEREPPKDWWLENACRTAAYRLRNSSYLREHHSDSGATQGQRGICAASMGIDREVAAG